MPWLPIFVDENDAESIVRWLNDAPDIAFLIGDGPKRWKAVTAVDRLMDGQWGLWQHTGEPLTLLHVSGPDEVISNPWEGWLEQRAGSNSTIPYFGPGHASTFWLDVWTRHRPYCPSERTTLQVLDSRWTGQKDCLSLSGFQWIGARYG